MKRSISFFLLLALFVFAGCRKKIIDVASPQFFTECFGGKFTQQTEQNLTVLDLTQGKDNTYYAMEQNGNTVIVQHFDSHGRQINISQTQFPESLLAMNLIACDDGSLLISAGVKVSFDSTVTIPSTYFRCLNIGSQSFCTPLYEILSFTELKYRSTKIYSSLIKIDKWGSIVWQKNFKGNYSLGKSLVKSGNDIYFASLFHNYSNTIIPDTGNITYDTLEFNFVKQNSTSLIKMDGNGNISWTKQLTNLTGLSDFNDTICSASLSIKNNHVMMQTGFDILLLDETGNIVWKKNIHPEFCNLSIPRVFPFSVCAGDIDFALTMFANNSTQVFLYDFNADLITTFQLNNFNTSNINQMSYSSNGQYILFDGQKLANFNSNGQNSFHSLIGFFTTFIFHPVIFTTCDGGFIFSKQNVTFIGTIGSTISDEIVKADANGNF